MKIEEGKEPAMDYATMNEIVDLLAELASAKYGEISAFAAKKTTEIHEINALIEKIESQYPKPDEEEK